MQLLELVQALQVGGSDTGDPIGFQKEARQRAGWQTDWYPGQLVAIQVELLQLFHATQGVRFDLRDLVLVQHQQLHLSVALEITGTQHAQVVPFCLSNRPQGGGEKEEAFTLDSSKYLIQRKGKKRFSIGRKSVLS